MQKKLSTHRKPAFRFWCHAVAGVDPQLMPDEKGKHQHCGLEHSLVGLLLLTHFVFGPVCTFQTGSRVIAV